MKFSIVMPVYNSECFLAKSIDSVISQSYGNWELIVVDDGSHDRSAEIIRNYAQKDERVKPFFTHNTGVSNARNHALERISGDLVIFLDSDDTWDKDALFKIEKTFEEYSCDIVNFNMYQTDEKGNVIGQVTQSLFEKPVLVSGEDEKREYIYPLLCGERAFGLVGNFAVKREIISANRFNSNMIMYEDLIFDIEMYKIANSIVCLPDYFYLYRSTSTGAVSNFKYQKIDDLKTAYKAKLELADENSLAENIKHKAVLFFCGNIIQFYSSILGHKKVCKEYRFKIMQDSFIMAAINKCKNLSIYPKDMKMLFGSPFIRWKMITILLMKRRVKKLLKK